MNVQTISMDPRIARIHFRDYRDKCREYRETRKKELEAKVTEGGRIFRQARHEKSLLEKEDEMLMKLYKELCRGSRILDIRTVFKESGVTPEWLPKLAIARADAKECWFRNINGGFLFSTNEHAHWYQHSNDRYAKHRIGLPGDTFPAQLTDLRWREANKLSAWPVKAMVPSIPVHLRPNNLDDMCIIWEAEWKKEPPVDPILVRRITQFHFSVIAQWDLTPVERSVLLGRI